MFHCLLYLYRYLKETYIGGKSSLFKKHFLSDRPSSVFNIWNLRRDLDGEKHWSQAGLATPSGLALEFIVDVNGNTLFPLLHPRRPILRVPVVLWAPLVHAKNPSSAGNHLTCVGRALPCYNYSVVGNLTQQTKQLLCCFGASIDFLKFLQKDLGFDTEIYITPDDQYGKYDPNKNKWTGVVGEILSGKADLALDLAENARRARFINMLYPNIPTALNILVEKEYSHGKEGIFVAQLILVNLTFFYKTYPSMD